MATPTYSQFIEDALREDNETCEMYPRSTVSPYAEVPLYFSLQEFGTTHAEVPSGQLFARRIVNSFQYSQGSPDIANRFMSGFIPNARGATVTLRLNHGDMDLGTEPPEADGVPLRDFSFGGRRVVYKHGGKCSLGEMGYDDYHTLLDGVCAGQPKIDGDSATFVIKGKDERLNHPLNTRVLYGTQYCVFLDGVNDFISCGVHAAHNITTLALKIEFLIWLEENPPASTSVLAKGTISTNGYHVRISNGGAVRFSTSQSGVNQTTVSTAIPLKQWVRVSCVLSGSNATIYFNGEDSTSSHATHIAPATASLNTLFIGKNTAGTEFVNCALDDFRISTMGLDEETVDEQCFRELDSIEATDTILYLKFNEKQGTNAPDDSPTNADGTLTGAIFAPSCMGNSDSAGRVIPMAFGNCRGIVPLPIDLDVQIHALHPGPIDSVVKARGGLNDDFFDATGTTVYTDFLDFITSDTDDGCYDIYNGDYWTLVRYGNKPNVTITFDILGDKTGGVYRDSPVSIARHLITGYGPNPFIDPTEINDAQWDALDASRSPEIRLYVGDDQTIQQALETVLASIGAAVWVEDTDGLVHIKIVGSPEIETAVADLTERNVKMGSLQTREGGTPFWKVNVFYEHCDFMFATGDVLEEMRGTEIEEYHRREWRLQYKNREFVRRLYLDSANYDVYTALVDPDDALFEANRLSNLLRRPDQGFTFFMPFTGDEIQLYDVVTFHYQDENVDGEKQSRYGTEEGSKFYVTGKRIVPREGGYIISIWRPIVQ